MDNTSRQRGAVVWLTGLSGSGKTSTALALAARLERAGKLVCVVDGDRLRAGLCSDLGFSPEDRAETGHPQAHHPQVATESWRADRGGQRRIGEPAEVGGTLRGEEARAGECSGHLSGARFSTRIQPE